jgi:HEAT repeat protein
MVLCVVAWRMVDHGHPQYAGLTLDRWLAELDLASPASGARALEAEHAVRAMGTNCFPRLFKLVTKEEPLWRRLALWVNGAQSFFRFPVTSTSLVRARAIEGYAVLGPAAKDAIPELVHVLDSSASPQVRSDVATALGRIGLAAQPAIPALMRAAQDSSPDLRRSARFAIANIQMCTPDLDRPHSF